MSSPCDIERIPTAKLTSSQKNILEKADQYGMEYQLDITESLSWNDFVDAVYQWEDLLEESNDLQLVPHQPGPPHADFFSSALSSIFSSQPQSFLRRFIVCLSGLFNWSFVSCRVFVAI